MNNQPRITSEYKSKEHILVCLSSSPSDTRIISAAARMANAFGATFTAVHVQTPGHEKLTESDRIRLRNNMLYAQQQGATVVTVYGDDIPYQIAEYARLSEVTRIVIGRSNTQSRHLWGKPSVSDRVADNVSDIEIHIIPDYYSDKTYHSRLAFFPEDFKPAVSDIIKTAVILIAATAIAIIFRGINFNDANIITVYILAVHLISLFTKGYTCSVIGSLASVLIFDFLFTRPYFAFHVYEIGYAFTFAIMLITSLITGTLTSRLKSNAKQSARSAHRTKVLFDTNQLLQKAQEDTEIISITAEQIMKLLGRDVVAYPEKDGKISDGIFFSVNPDTTKNFFRFIGEETAAKWAFTNRRRCGATTEDFSDSKGLYLTIGDSNRIYGIIGILIDGIPLDSFEYSVVMSIIGECAMGVEKIRNAIAKEEATARAKNEQLRSNLLRTISHDLRTPLTSISGNADNLLSNYNKMDKDSMEQAFTDIYDDSQWLISVVENLLSVTRIEEGRMKLNFSEEIIDDIVTEATQHISRKKSGRSVELDLAEELMMVKADPRLIVQVIINLLDNAIKYTPSDSKIVLSTRREENFVRVSVADNGPGIDSKSKERIFEMFYTVDKKLADSRRSLGLGLSLCQSIVNAHGGSIKLTDNQPTGCIFTFTLPLSEVKIYE